MDKHDLWSALSDRTRRRIIEILRDRGPQRTGDLAAFFEVSRFAVMKHLDHLVEVDLVVIRRQGRDRWNHLNTQRLAEVIAWLSGVIETEGVTREGDALLDVPVVRARRHGAEVISVPAPDAGGRWSDPEDAARRHAAELIIQGLDDVRPSVERVVPLPQPLSAARRKLCSD